MLANHWILLSKCSVKKVHRALHPFYGQFNRPTEAAIRSIVTKFRWTLNQQHAYVECELKKISQLYRPVLMPIIDSWPFAAIGPLLLNNVVNFAEGFRCEVFQKTAGARIEAEWALGKLTEDPLLFIEKLCWATKLIFGSMGA